MSDKIAVDSNRCSVIALNRNQYNCILCSDEFYFIGKPPNLIIPDTYNFDKLRGISTGYTLILADAWNHKLSSDANHYWQHMIMERESRGVLVLKSKW